MAAERRPIMAAMVGRWNHLAIALTLSLVGCDDEKSAASEPADAPKSAEGTKLEQAIDEEVEAQTGAENFTKGMAKKGCELLTPELVASTFDVPKDELEQMKMMGCIYNWKSGDQMLQVNLTLAKAHDTVADAKRWFASSTASKTKDEVQGQMKELKARVKERDEVQGKVKQKAADSLMDAAMDIGPITYEDVAGVGDEARVNDRDGSMWVRVRNLTFSIAAYKGPKQPDIDLVGMKPKEVIAASKKATEAWMAETSEERKAQATKIAKRVIAEL